MQRVPNGGVATREAAAVPHDHVLHDVPHRVGGEQLVILKAGPDCVFFSTTTTASRAPIAFDVLSIVPIACTTFPARRTSACRCAPLRRGRARAPRDLIVASYVRMSRPPLAW